MRKYAILKEPVPMNHYGDMVKKVMIYAMKKGVSFFLFTSVDDNGCSADYYFTDLDAAEECGQDYGVKPDDWIIIADPLPDCRHDLIASVPLKSR